MNTMKLMQILIALVAGLIAGEYVNQCILKLPEGTNNNLRKFKCHNCNHNLSIPDMLPGINYILLKGKCRYCGYKIPIHYPIIEVLNGICYALVIATQDWSIKTILCCALTSVLMTITIIDYKHKIIPNECNTALFAIAIITTLTDKENVLIHIAGLITMLITFGSIYIITKGKGIGGGDLKMMVPCGLMLGVYGGIIATIIACALTLITYPFILMYSKSENKKQISFGPFLAIGVLIMMLWNQQIVDKYMQLINNILQI